MEFDFVELEDAEVGSLSLDEVLLFDSDFSLSILTSSVN